MKYQQNALNMMDYSWILNVFTPSRSMEQQKQSMLHRVKSDPLLPLMNLVYGCVTSNRMWISRTFSVGARNGLTGDLEIFWKVHQLVCHWPVFVKLTLFANVFERVVFFLWNVSGLSGKVSIVTLHTTIYLNLIVLPCDIQLCKVHV